MLTLLRKTALFLAFFAGLAGAVHADGFIVVPEPGPVARAFPLQVKYHHVDVTIDGLTAETAIDQEFYNPTGSRLEGQYIFPIPEGAVIKKFSMYIDGKETEAEMLDAAKARDIYEGIVRQMKDPALLEYNGRGIFKVRIFPIEPYSTKRVKITYREALTRDSGTVEYHYPLNTEKFSAGNLESVRITVSIAGNGKIKNVYSPTHPVAVDNAAAEKAVARFEQKNVKPDTDFKLFYTTDSSRFGASLITTRLDGKPGYFLLNLSPGLEQLEEEPEPKDIAFVLDVSGSMSGDKIEQAKKALLFCVENLNPEDRFELIRFSTDTDELFGGLVKADRKNIGRARKLIEDLKARGGTDIGGALQAALSKKRDGKRPYMVIFITDGQPTVGTTNPDDILALVKNSNRAGTRVFTFGVGFDINTLLLDKITEETKAYRTYITPDEDIEVKVSEFYTKVQSPVLTDVRLSVDGAVKVSKIYPQVLPDLFQGSSVTVLGEYENNGPAKLRLTGRMKGQEKTFTYDVIFAEEDGRHDFIAALWASRRVGFLLDQVRLHGENRELVDEIVLLAREHGIITPYTSYLILEDERELVRRNVIRPADQTLGNVMPSAEAFTDKAKKEYEGMKAASGRDSVQSSMEIQDLSRADNAAETKQGTDRLSFTDKSGREQRMESQVRNIQGRAFYQSGELWIDSRIQKKPNTPVKKIQFLSKEYFDLMKQSPEAAEILSLGRNVRFLYRNSVYEIES